MNGANRPAPLSLYVCTWLSASYLLAYFNKDQLSLTNSRDVLQTNKVDDHCDKLNSDRTKLTTLRVKSRQFSATAPAFNLPNLHLALPLG